MTVFTRTLDLGPSTGLRIAVKDTIDIAGYPTMAGSRALAAAPPALRHAEVVERVLSAGCRIVGKTTLHELAFGVTGINDWSGTPLNPHFPDLIPGGSSSGSAAAVAMGLADAALGTDTGGSIRIPAACCGIWGLKPTFGRISRRGVMPELSTLDCVGPFAGDSETLARVMEIIDPTFRSVSVDSARLGVLVVEAAPHIRAAINSALAASRMSLTAIKPEGMDEAFNAGLAVINAETWKAAGALVETGLVGEDVATRLLIAAKTTPDQVADGELVQTRFTAAIDLLLEDADALVLPTLSDRPPTIVEGRLNRSAVALTKYVRPFNLSGHPALSMPLQVGAAGPVSLQLVGRKGDDARLCAIAVALAQSSSAPLG